MALTQMQIIRSLGEAMAWFERELQWGVPATELRHLSGRIGELYAALITNGQMANEVNQQGYDVVSSDGDRISVKTTAVIGSSGHIVFNPNTLDKVDRIVILRINTEEMQIETLLNETTDQAKQLMSSTNSNGKVSISLSKLTSSPVKKQDIPAIKTVSVPPYEIRELENGAIEVEAEGVLCTAKPVLRELAQKYNLSILNSNGNPCNTRQLGSLIIKVVNSGSENA